MPKDRFWKIFAVLLTSYLIAGLFSFDMLGVWKYQAIVLVVCLVGISIGLYTLYRLNRWKISAIALAICLAAVLFGFYSLIKMSHREPLVRYVLVTLAILVGFLHTLYRIGRWKTVAIWLMPCVLLFAYGASIFAYSNRIPPSALWRYFTEAQLLPESKLRQLRCWRKGPIVLQPGPPGSWDEEGVAIPSILRAGDGWMMWYQSRGYEQIGLAYSTDGIHWTKEVSNPVLRPGPPGSWDEESAGAPSVIKMGDTYMMWYDGSRGFRDAVALGSHQIGLAYSKDGIQWTKEPTNPVLKLGMDGSMDDLVVGASFVLKEDNGYRMYFDMRGTEFRNGEAYQIGWATSSDGVNWVKGPTPALSLGPRGVFDDSFVDDAHVIKVGNTYIMFYEGADGYYHGRKKYLGFATSLDGITWVKDPTNPILKPGSPGSWDSVNVASAWIEQVGSDYWMWYSGSDGDSGTWQIALATSCEK